MSAEDQKLLDAALAAKSTADAQLRDTVRDVLTRASVREVAEATGLSTNTVSRWKRGE